MRKFIIIFIFLCSFMFGQNYPFLHYTLKEGLPQSQVSAICQSPNGYLLLGTFDGLVRFDGTEFQTYTKHEGLESNMITAMHADQRGVVWIGHPRGGISLYDTKNNTFSSLSNLENYSTGSIFTITEDKNGTLYFGTSDGLLLKYAQDEITKITISENQRAIQNILADQFGQIWILSANNLFLLDPKDNSVQTVEALRHLNGSILQLMELEKGNLLISLAGQGISLIRYDHRQVHSIHPVSISGLPDPQITQMLLDNQKNIWLYSLHQGLIRFPVEAVTEHAIQRYLLLNESNGFTKARVLSLSEDSYGGIWIGTSGDGLYKFVGDYFMFYDENSGLHSNVVFGIGKDHTNQLWVSDNFGLTVFDASNSPYLKKIKYSINNRNGGFGTHISRILPVDDRSVWLASVGGGIHIYDPVTFSKKHLTTEDGLPSNIIYDLDMDSNDNIWIASSEGGVFRIQKNSLHVTRILPNEHYQANRFYSIFIDSRNKIWMGSIDDGIYVYDKGTISHIQVINGKKISSVTCFAEDQHGNIWIGTNSEGVFVQRHNSFINLSRQTGLSGDLPFFLQADGEYMYVGTSNGIDRVNINDFSILHFDQHLGFYPRETNLHAVLPDRNGLWFGTIQGLAYFNKSEIHLPDSVLYLGVERAVYFPTNTPLKQHIQLPHDQTHLRFYINAVYLPRPYQILYSFMLDGYDNAFSHFRPDPYIAYTSLPPGTYTLKVRAKLKFSDKVTEKSVFYFTITPPFWHSPFFIIPAIFAILATILFAFRLYRKHEINEKERLKQIIEEQTKGIKEERNKLVEALKQLRESEEKFRSLAEATNAAIFIYQGESFVYANPATQKISGYGWKEFKKGKFWDIVHPDHKEMIRERGKARLLGKPVPSSYEFKIICKDGSVKWVDFTSTFINYMGQPAALGTAIDITEKKEAIEKLMQSSKSFEALFNYIPDLIYIQDLDGRFIDVNESVIKTYGYPKEKFIGNDPSFLAVPGKNNLDEVQEAIQKACLGIPQRFPFWGKKADGSIFPKEVRVTRGSYFGKDVLIAIARDISERMEYEAKLQSERDLLNTTLSSIQDGVITLDKQYRIILMNTIAETLCGISTKKALEKDINDILEIYKIEEESEERKITFEALNQLGEVLLSLAEFKLINQQTKNFRIVQIRITPLYHQEEIEGYVVILSDISEKRRYLEELSKAQKLESLSLMAGGIAHDFNNILTSILANIEMAQYKTKEADLAKYLQGSIDNIMRAKHLTQQLLTFAKGGAPVKEPKNIVKFIKGIAEFSLAGSNVKSNIEYEDNIFNVDIDPDQMNQVIKNLVINAKEAMPDGGVLTIKIENFILFDQSDLSLPKGRYVRIKFIDTGVGIPKKYLSKIFDPFFTTKKSGSGLGLATSYSIIRKHLGAITAESVPGKGTTFTLYLPASIHQTPIEESEKENGAIQCHLEGNILVMDDEAEIRKVVKEFLESCGVQVDEAADGEEAIKKYREKMSNGHKYDLLIMDLTIPGGMGGKDAIKKLLEIDPEVKALVSSGYSNDDSMSNFKKYGFVDVVKKPYLLNEFIGIIKKHLS